MKKHKLTKEEDTATKASLSIQHVLNLDLYAAYDVDLDKIVLFTGTNVIDEEEHDSDVIKQGKHLILDIDFSNSTWFDRLYLDIERTFVGKE